MSAVTSVILTRALDGLAMRAAATAQNIANANSREFHPIAVDFEASLRTAAAQGDDAVRALSFRPSPEAHASFGDEPRLDLELATASDTGMRYNALLDLLGREMQLSRTVLQGER